jgi:hypothetical protein
MSRFEYKVSTRKPTKGDGSSEFISLSSVTFVTFAFFGVTVTLS